MLPNFWLLFWHVRGRQLTKANGRADIWYGVCALLVTKDIVCHQLHLKFIQMVCRPVLQHGIISIISMLFPRRRPFFTYNSGGTLGRMEQFIRL